ncbi:MAG: DUF4870 domain-containing protein [Deltaproteobacteria bacterium]|nr:DUF4870 domain-containing protein [Deltaproteobacteria bacterium]
MSEENYQNQSGQEHPYSAQSGGSQGGGSGLDANLASCLCYLCGFLTGFIFLLLERNNKTVRFHAWQAILLNFTLIALYIATFIMMQIPWIGVLFWVVYFLMGPASLVLTIVLMVKAYQGQRVNLPYISDYADKLANGA